MSRGNENEGRPTMTTANAKMKGSSTGAGRHPREQRGRECESGGRRSMRRISIPVRTVPAVDPGPQAAALSGPRAGRRDLHRAPGAGAALPVPGSDRRRTAVRVRVRRRRVRSDIARSLSNESPTNSQGFARQREIVHAASRSAAGCSRSRGNGHLLRVGVRMVRDH